MVWGSTYLGMAVVVETVPPFLGMGTRFLAAALTLGTLIAVVRGPRRLRVPMRQVATALMIGALLLLGGNGVVAAAERVVPSGVAALLVACTPVWVVGLRWVTGDRPHRATIAGVALGFVGLTALVIVASGGDEAAGFGYQPATALVELLWTLAVLAASFSWALGSFLTARFARQERLPDDPLVFTFWQFVGGAGGLVIVGAVTGESLPAISSLTGRAVLAWGYLVLAGVLAFLAYTWLLRNARLSLVATYAYVNPVVAVILGWWLKDESLTMAIVACGLIIVLGVALVVRGERQPAPVAPPPDGATTAGPSS